jgi:hypothetical protein
VSYVLLHRVAAQEAVTGPGSMSVVLWKGRRRRASISFPSSVLPVPWDRFYVVDIGSRCSQTRQGAARLLPWIG